MRIGHTPVACRRSRRPYGASRAARFQLVQKQEYMWCSKRIACAGVLMTGMLGVLAGCRARAARRRRRGKPLAHDADYLVNGMYL